MRPMLNISPAHRPTNTKTPARHNARSQAKARAPAPTGLDRLCQPTRGNGPTEAHNSAGSTTSARLIPPPAPVDTTPPRRQPHNLPLPITPTRLTGGREADTWEAVDRPVLIRDRDRGEEGYVDGVGLFLSYLFAQLTYVRTLVFFFVFAPCTYSAGLAIN